MAFTMKRMAQIFACAALFLAGAATGALYGRSAAAQNRFGQPKTVLHVVVYKLKDTTSEYDKQQIFDGLKDVAKKVPGVKNVWLKTERNQLKDFTGIYAIEFTTPDAAADYAESPVHEAWSKKWQSIRENSLSFQISNP